MPSPPTIAGTCPCGQQKGLVIQAATNVHVTYNYTHNTSGSPSQGSYGAPAPVPPTPIGPPPIDPNAPVIRREFRTLPEEEQKRFCDAVEKMMELRPDWQQWIQIDPAMGPPPANEMPCEFFRLASYHGWPFWGDRDGKAGGFCAHGIETFPVWHRPYMVDFEQALQAADRALGRDGRIALHYWGWDTLDPETAEPVVNGQCMPQMIRDRFANFRTEMIPQALAKAVSKPDTDDIYTIQDLVDRGYFETTPEEELKNNLKFYQVHSNAVSAMAQLLHSRAASTASQNNGTHRSLEEPHNQMHNACGFPMSDVPFSAFHPIFWLHHSNVDRLYEAYLQNMRKLGLNPEDQFSKCNLELFAKPLTPFHHPKYLAGGKESLFYPTFVFNDTPTLGYKYDVLPEVKPLVPRELQMSSQPTMAMIEGVDPKKFRGKSFNFHFFIVEDGKTFVPPSDRAQFFKEPEYAGMDALFGAKSGPCINCDQRGLLTMKLDISENLRARGLERDKVHVEAVVELLGPKKALYSPEELGMSPPKLMGPVIALSSGATVAESLQEQQQQQQRQPTHGSVTLPGWPALPTLGATAADEPVVPAPPHTADDPELAVALPDGVPPVSTEERQALKYLALYGYINPKAVPAAPAAPAPPAAPAAAAQLMLMSLGGKGPEVKTDATAVVTPAKNEKFTYLQKQLGIKAVMEGKLDQPTLTALANRSRYNNRPEGMGAPEKPTFRVGSDVFWSITPPCYLDSYIAEQEMKRALAQWGAVVNLNFIKADASHPANLVVSFTSLDEYEKKNRGKELDVLDVGPGNYVYKHHLSVVASDAAAAEGQQKVMLDSRWAFWMLPTTPEGVRDYFGAFYLAPVLLHDIGTALGLHSSGGPDDVMCPFYSDSHKVLTENDKSRAATLYPGK